MSSVRLTDEAKQDLREIGLYIAQDNPDRAISFVLELQRKCQQIAGQPRLHPIRHELPDTIRAVRHKKYLIFYALAPDDEVVVLRILHGSRNIPDTVKSSL